MRVGEEVDVPAAAVGDVRVALRRPEVGVAEHLLDGPEIGSPLQKVRRERVTQEMGVNPRRLQPSAIGELAQDEEGAGARQRPTARVEEELGPVASVEVGTAEREIATDGLRGGSSERDEPLFRSLADNADDAFLERHAVLLQSDGFGDPEPRAVQELDERPVAQRARRRADCGVDEPFGFGRREGAR